MKRLFFLFLALCVVSCDGDGGGGGGGAGDPGETYTVTYEENGSTVGDVPVDSNTYSTGAGITIESNTNGLVKAGFDFSGWNTEPDGSGIAYAPGQVVAMGNEDMVLYSMWNSASTAASVHSYTWMNKVSEFSVNDTKVDSSGNIYMVGNESITNKVLLKYNSSGDLQWEKSYTAASSSYKAVFRSVEIDGSGNLYAAGIVQGTQEYDFGNSVKAAGNGSSNSFLLVKYNADGTAQWAKSAEIVSGNGNSEYNSISTDGTYLYLAGEISNKTVVFGNSITSIGSYLNGNVLLVKYNLDGAAQWAKTVTAAADISSLQKVMTDNSGNCYVAAEVRGTGEFDFGNSVKINGPATGYNDVLVKYDTTGTAQYAKNIIDDKNDYSIDGVGNLYAVGKISGTGTIDLGDGVSVIGAHSGYGVLIVKYNSTGVTQWGRTIESATKDSFFKSIDVDRSTGFIYAVGIINGIGTTDFGSNVRITQCFNGNTGLILKYNSLGQAQWAQTINDGTGGSSYESVYCRGGVIFAKGAIGAGSYNFGNGVTSTGTGSVSITNG